MRDIKFRGISLERKAKGKWVYGYYWHDKKRKEYIIIIDGLENGTENYEDIIVDSKTVGQFTGLLDKNGTEVYEGDVAKYEGGYYGDAAFGDNEPWIRRMEKGTIQYENGRFGPLGSDHSKIEVIGNIYENPLEEAL